MPPFDSRLVLGMVMIIRCVIIFILVAVLAIIYCSERSTVQIRIRKSPYMFVFVVAMVSVIIMISR